MKTMGPNLGLVENNVPILGLFGTIVICRQLWIFKMVLPN